MRARFKKIGFACAMVFVTACGSSGSSGTSTTTGTTTGTASASDLTSFSTIPDMNLDSLDAATNSESASVSSRMLNMEEASGTDFKEPSIDGCITRAMVDQLKGEMQAFQHNKCMMEAVEANTAFAIPLDKYEFYEMTMPDPDNGGGPGNQTPQSGNGQAAIGSVPLKVMRAKVGLVDGIVRLALCEQKESVFEQRMSFSAGITDGLFNTQMISKHDSPFSDESGFSRLNAQLETDDLALLTAEHPAVLQGQFGDGDKRGGKIKVTVGRDEQDLIFNRVEGSHQSDNAEYGSWHDVAFGQFNGTGGCTQHTSVGSAPARTVEDIIPQEGPGAAFMAAAFAEAGFGPTDQICWVKVENPETANFPGDFVRAAGNGGMCTHENSGTACYGFDFNNADFDANVDADVDADVDVEAFVMPTETAPYFDLVSAADTNFDNEVPTIEFAGVDFWDCTAPAGETFQTINFVGNMALGTAVRACEEEFRDERHSEMKSCFDEHNEAEAENKTGEEFDDGSGDTDDPEEELQ